MPHNTAKVSIYPDDKEKIMEECKKLFLEEHPDMKDIKVSYHFMIKKIIEFYLK